MTEANAYGSPVLIEEGAWAGWSTWGYGADPYETMTGPYYLQKHDGAWRCAVMAERKHCNASGALHGGFLMTFADFALFAFALDHLTPSGAVTIGFSSEFLAAGQPGAPVYATGETLRATRSLVFARGIMTQHDKPIFSFSGTLKKLG